MIPKTPHSNPASGRGDSVASLPVAALKFMLGLPGFQSPSDENERAKCVFDLEVIFPKMGLT
jgi:hypothetical protein